MRVKEFMKTNIKEISEEASLSQAEYLMNQSFLHHLVVINESDEMIGLLSAADMGGIADKDRHTVSEVMTRDLVWIDPDASAQDAANLMRGHGIGCLPVLDQAKKELLGIITDTDLLEMIGKGQELHYPNAERRPIRRFPPGIRSRIHFH